jgi:Protein of unknown function (DUF2865)
MSVVRRRLASQVAAGRAVDFRTSLTWRGAALSSALFALALAAGDAPSQSAGCARCASVPVAPEAAAPQRTAEPRRMKRVALRFDLRPERPKRGPFGGSYVVCVRACDGSFFPVSYFGGNPSELQKVCQSLCPNATVALYSLPFGGTIDEAVSINGSVATILTKDAWRWWAGSDRSCGPVEQVGDKGGLAADIMTVNLSNLSLPHHRHGLETRQRLPRRTETAEAEPRPDKALDTPVVLLDDVVQIFTLSQTSAAP